MTPGACRPCPGVPGIGSCRVLEKAGMRREQHGVEDSWHAELGWVDGYQYALLARELRAQQAAAVRG